MDEKNPIEPSVLREIGGALVIFGKAAAVTSVFAAGVWICTRINRPVAWYAAAGIGSAGLIAFIAWRGYRDSVQSFERQKEDQAWHEELERKDQERREEWARKDRARDEEWRKADEKWRGGGKSA